MAYTSYSQKLKDPRWQRRRLEVFERDNFSCVVCRCKTKELQVHHVDYIPGVDTWEYPLDMLMTLDVDCHKEQQGRHILESNLAKTLRMKGFLFSDLLALSCLVDTNRKFTISLLKTLRENG